MIDRCFVFEEIFDMSEVGAFPRVVSLLDYKKQRKNKLESYNKNKKVLQNSSSSSNLVTKANNSVLSDSDKNISNDNRFGSIIKKNKEARKKLTEKRLRKNTFVLRSYNLKK